MIQFQVRLRHFSAVYLKSSILDKRFLKIFNKQNVGIIFTLIALLVFREQLQVH